MRPPHGGRPAPPASRRADRDRPGRSSAERPDRARVPKRAALGALGSIADRRRVGAAGSHVRLRHPVHDPRHRHRGPRGTAGRRRPGHSRPDRNAGRQHPEPLRHNPGLPDDPPCSRARTSPPGTQRHHGRRTSDGRCATQNAPSAAIGSVCSGVPCGTSKRPPPTPILGPRCVRASPGLPGPARHLYGRRPSPGPPGSRSRSGRASRPPRRRIAPAGADASHQQGSRQPWRARTRHASGLSLLAVRAHVTMHRQSGCR